MRFESMSSGDKGRESQKSTELGPDAPIRAYRFREV